MPTAGGAREPDVPAHVTWAVPDAAGEVRASRPAFEDSEPHVGQRDETLHLQKYLRPKPGAEPSEGQFERYQASSLYALQR